ncbi:MAG: TetR/AcrR family transcriptional regulator [Gammaproteobacteria bacterium]
MNATARPSSAREQTRKQLIEAGEKLFAESGIDAVSLRQINVAAGQKNSSAAHYHFGSKDALIIAIYEYRMEHVNTRRRQHLERLRTQKKVSVRDVVECIVYPIVEEIDSSKSGSSYIRFLAQAMGHPQLDLTELWKNPHGEALGQALELLRSTLPKMDAALFGQRFGLTLEQIFHSLADRERLRTSSKKSFGVDSTVFVSNLVDFIAGALAADVSDMTKQELKRATRSAG